MNNFSFFQIFLKRLVLQTCKNQGLFGKGLNIFIFYIDWETSFITYTNLSQISHT